MKSSTESILIWQITKSTVALFLLIIQPVLLSTSSAQQLISIDDVSSSVGSLDSKSEIALKSKVSEACNKLEFCEIILDAENRYNSKQYNDDQIIVDYSCIEKQAQRVMSRKQAFNNDIRRQKMIIDCRNSHPPIAPCSSTKPNHSDYPFSYYEFAKGGLLGILFTSLVSVLSSR